MGTTLHAIAPLAQNNWVVGTLLIVGIVLLCAVLSAEDDKPR